MPSLSETLAHLSTIRSKATPRDQPSGRLTDLGNLGPNPGALVAKAYIPQGLARHAPLVVVLHGCTQNADGYDIGSGWSQMADRHGFALLYPEQRRQNNPNLCFNWFSPEDTRRGSGEAQSIREMIAGMVERHALDPFRIFVTGLSAGGAMASVMLATYPELFAGGAVIAGLPYGCAATIPQALERMRGQGFPAEAELSGLVRRASDHHGTWPTLSVWHGSADMTVNRANAAAIVDQWRALHGVEVEPSRTDMVDGYPRRVWTNGDGREVIEEYSITGMGHGTPLATHDPEGCGKAGAHMLEANISSTRHLCAFWEIAGERERSFQPTSPVPATLSRRPEKIWTDEAGGKAPAAGPNKVGQIIENALRAAGLMH